MRVFLVLAGAAGLGFAGDAIAAGNGFGSDGIAHGRVLPTGSASFRAAPARPVGKVRETGSLRRTEVASAARVADDGWGEGGSSAVSRAEELRSWVTEPSERGARGYMGEVTWRTVREMTADFRGKERTVLKIRSVIETRGVDLAITISKNHDPSIPASHLIDMAFELTRHFGGDRIAEVSAILMSPTDQLTMPAAHSRGKPLGGEIEKRRRGRFRMELAKGEGDWKRNREHLTGNGWMDLAIVYESEQKAILTIAVGEPGKRAIEQAIAAWETE